MAIVKIIARIKKVKFIYITASNVYIKIVINSADLVSDAINARIINEIIGVLNIYVRRNVNG